MTGRVWLQPWLTDSEKKRNYKISSWIPCFFLAEPLLPFSQKNGTKNWIECTFYKWTRIRSVFWKFQTKWKKWQLKNHDREIFPSFLRIHKSFDHAFCIEKTDDHLFYRGFGRSNLRQTNENHRQTFYAFWTDESFASQREKTFSENFPRAQKWFSSLRDVFSLHDTVYSQHSVT